MHSDAGGGGGELSFFSAYEGLKTKTKYGKIHKNHLKKMGVEFNIIDQAIFFSPILAISLPLCCLNPCTMLGIDGQLKPD